MRARDSISRFVGWLVGWFVGPSVADSPEHATYGDRPCCKNKELFLSNNFLREFELESAETTNILEFDIISPQMLSVNGFCTVKSRYNGSKRNRKFLKYEISIVLRHL